MLASNSDCPFIRELYKGFQVETITAARSTNPKASKRDKIHRIFVSRLKPLPTHISALSGS